MYATTRGRWTYWTLLVVWAVGFSICVGPALFGTQHWNLGGLGGFVGAAVGARWRDGDFWALPKPDRRRVERTVLTGVPSGSAALDRIAHDRLVRAVKGRSRGNTVTSVVLAFLAPAASVLAAVRCGNPWYLLAIAPTGVLIVTVGTVRVRREHPEQRVRRFDDATGRGTA